MPTVGRVERSAAMKKIMGWVKLHPYNIAQKVQIVVEHFRQNVAPLLSGQAKAMVVVASSSAVPCRESRFWRTDAESVMLDKDM